MFGKLVSSSIRHNEILFCSSGQSMIVELIANSCQLEKGIFDPNDEETVDRLLQCANAAIPFFSVSFCPYKKSLFLFESSSFYFESCFAL